MNILDTPYYKTNLLKNANFFLERFPELARTMHLNSKTEIEKIVALIPTDYLLQEAKISSTEKIICTANIHGKFIHSKYNPIREAEQMLNSDFFTNDESKKNFVFYGLGLGYLPELYAAKNIDANLIIIEPDIFLFLFFLASRDLDCFFRHKNLSLILGAYPNEALNFLEGLPNKNYKIFKQNAIMDVSPSWFLELETLKKRKIEKDELNKNTLKKFGKLWTKNFFKNLSQLQKAFNILQFKNAFADFPVIIIAAGPSLHSVLPLIKKYADRFVIISTDTALRACLHFDLIPDFVLFMDAQYWNYLHIADMDLSSSILVTELAVYPPVFRLKTKANVLASSVFPFASVIENKFGGLGKVVTGGSVATACWDFARTLGSKKIIMAGLDLGFPNFQTHFKGSRFEEDANKSSMRLKTAEQYSHQALYSAHPEIAAGYSKKILTDARMKMYAWWFESKIEEFKDVQTFNLFPQGLKIPNMPAIFETQFIEIAEHSMCSFALKKTVLKIILDSERTKHNLSEIILSIKNELAELNCNAQKALEILDELYSDNLDIKNKNYLLKKLDSIDKILRTSEFNTSLGFDILINGDEPKDATLKDSGCSSSDETYKIQKKFYSILLQNVKILLQRISDTDISNEINSKR